MLSSQLHDLPFQLGNVVGSTLVEVLYALVDTFHAMPLALCARVKLIAAILLRAALLAGAGSTRPFALLVWILASRS